MTCQIRASVYVNVYLHLKEVRKIKRLFLKAISIFLIAACVLSISSCNASSPKKYTEYYLDYFDTATTVIGYAESEEEFCSVTDIVRETLDRYHKFYDIYNSYEGITNLADINSLHGGVHKTHSVSSEIIDLLKYSKEMYNLTYGEVNIAMGSVLSLWHTAREDALSNPEAAEVPDAYLLESAAEHTNIDDVVIDEDNMTVFLADPEMTLDVGAIAKGFVAEKIAMELADRGITGFILNLGGNIRVLGKKPDGSDWIAGITDPDAPDSDNYKAYVSLCDKALVTSGSYQRFYYVADTSYHHIIDKDTLYPLSYFKSVTVLCNDSGLADALSTALFNMSYTDGAALIETIEGAEAMWIYSDGKTAYSSGFESCICNN